MFNIFKDFQDFIRSDTNEIINSKLNSTVRKYLYLYNDNIINCKLIIQNITNSSVITISNYKYQSLKSDELHFIIGFRKTVLIIKQSLLPKLQPLLMKMNKLKICFFEDTKNFFDKSIKIEYEELEKNNFFEKEISAISNEFFNYNSKQFQYKEFLDKIKSCISGYLILQCYCDLDYDRFIDFYSKSKEKIIPKEMNENELIELRLKGIGSLFSTVLCYHIYDEKLYIVKKPISNDFEIKKLLQREQYNYTKIKHPLIPKYYGTVNIKGKICLVIEFINGKPLSLVDCFQFSISEQIRFIMQLLSVIKYLHKNHFIYRDLKPSNVMIDKNKTIVVIDFDRMIEDKNIKNESNNLQTIDFGSNFYAPEILTKNFTNKCDIYSFGKMISVIIPDIEIKKYYYLMIYFHYLSCIDKNPEKRLSASILYFNLFIFIFIERKHFKLDISLAFNQNDPNSQFQLGLIYFENKLVARNINKSIYYFMLAANQNDPKAQYYLGIIYYKGEYISRDINKSIYYFSLAANQNISEAQYYLGLIYYEDQYISRDINKSIYYFSLAANQNDPKAQYYLGIIYYEGQYISRDINKSIYYFSFAANQNDPKAQFYLGIIYYSGLYISRDINKSIFYLSLAANQNISEAQYYLGIIYYEGQYISRDINKSIYYFSLAANQNDPKAQFYLGLIYYLGQYISQGINKSIYYFMLAANQNISEAQFNLGVIYYEGQYISRDINKSIYYFSFAANQNDPKAQYNLGLIYYSGLYISRDINKSIFYFSLAANQNISEAQYYLGIIYYEGQYISRDINKSIYYFSLAANQNHMNAQINLGIIYYEGQYIPRDIKKAIYYFKKAANQNLPQAQYMLGLIYENDKYIPRDINKSIYYYSLAANQNDLESLNHLGLIYYEGKYISRNIDKAIFYLSHAANQNHPKSQFNLGVIYYEGQYISRDINKAIHYYSLAANQNIPQAQYNLGLINYFGFYIKQDIKRGIYWITQSSNNGNIEAYLSLGFLYQEGKYIKRNIEESIKYYKKASSYNNQYAKNNLGIIYKNNVEKKYDYTVYFEEAIRQKNDPVSMYNLSHTYIYEYQDEKLINKSIELLIKSSNLGFKQSIGLLCLIILKNFFTKHKNQNEMINVAYIEQELSIFANISTELIFLIINIIQEHQLYEKKIFEYYYKKYKELEFIYDFSNKPICIKCLYDGENEIKLENSNEEYKVTKEFYEGFGLDIYQNS